MSIPLPQARPQVTLTFDFGAEVDLTREISGDFGRFLSSFEFKGMANGGFTVRGRMIDPHFNQFDTIIENNYFAESRRKPSIITFQLRWGPESEALFPESATKTQKAYLISLKASGKGDDTGILEFVAIDPASWLLNKGDGNGGVYKGKVSDAIKQVVKQYAPDVKLNISETIDSKEGKWWMMRQDPKSFISSLFDWSSSVTKTKTQWIFAPGSQKNGKFDLVIKEQGELKSKQRAFYRYLDGDGHDSIENWELLADNALSIVETKLITQGLSAVSGQYLDITTDIQEDQVVVSDKNTTNKKIANIKPSGGFSKPETGHSDTSATGWTSVSAIPENSAGDLGIHYGEYIDGRPRGMWLNMTNSLMRIKIECVGHGEWSSCEGLGVDTVFIKWAASSKTKDLVDGPDKRFFWTTGTWLVYGFHHRLTRGFWHTDLYLARFDHDSKAKKVGPLQE